MRSVLAGCLPHLRPTVACCALMAAGMVLAGCMAQHSAPQHHASQRRMPTTQPAMGSAAAPSQSPAASEPANSQATAPAAEPQNSQTTAPPFEPATQSVPAVTTQATVMHPPVRERTSPKASASPQQSSPYEPGQIISGEQSAPSPLRFSAQGTFLYGPVNGNTQVPLGGKAGTTTGNQPHLGNIGINDAHDWDGELAVGWDPQEQIYIGGQMIHLSGGDRLPKGFVSHGVRFPKGTPVESNVRLDWYRFGYRYQFALDTAPNGVPDVTLTPWIEGLVWNFGYHLSGGKAGTVGRAFNELGVQLGGTIAWRPEGGPLSLEAYAGSFPQISNMAQISVEGLRARYRFYHVRQADFSVLLGVQWEQQDFKDSEKPLDNNIKARFGPMLETGLQISF